MAARVRKVEGRTISQFALHVGVGTTTVRRWVEEGRLDVVEYRNDHPFGRGGEEPLLILILDNTRPPLRIPVA